MVECVCSMYKALGSNHSIVEGRKGGREGGGREGGRDRR
jgi:hypothetical protein